MSSYHFGVAATAVSVIPMFNYGKLNIKNKVDYMKDYAKKDILSTGNANKDALINSKIMNATVGTVATESAGLGLDLYGRAATMKDKDEC